MGLGYKTQEGSGSLAKFALIRFYFPSADTIGVNS